MWKTLVLSAALTAVVTLPAAAQQGAADIGQRLLQDAAIKAAVDAIRADEATTIDDQVRFCEIEAPPFGEAARAAAYAQAFREIGLANVRVDREGNVLGEWRGERSRPHLVFSAHLDTVFPAGTPVAVTREGSVLKGPGIGDDCRGLAVVLAVARTIARRNLRLPGTITFVATVGEEGLGDLRGVKFLFNEGLKGQVDRFVSIDGTGLGMTSVAVGSLRYRTTFKGPGGHSYGAFGMVNPILALGRAAARIGNFEVPFVPKTTFSIGRIGGGTSVNSIPYEAWMEVDMRSADPASLQSLDAKFHRAVDDAVADENARWGRLDLTAEKTLVGNRPAGRTPAGSPLVVAAESVTRALGFPGEFGEGSTDSNIPMSLGIPAITIGGGGRGSRAHSLDESFDSTDSWQGSVRALLLAVALAQE